MNYCNNDDGLFILFEIMFYLNEHELEDRNLEFALNNIADM